MSHLIMAGGRYLSQMGWLTVKTGALEFVSRGAAEDWLKAERVSPMLRGRQVDIVETKADETAPMFGGQRHIASEYDPFADG